MDFGVITLNENFISFVHNVFKQNIEILHGSEISEDEWRLYLIGKDADPHEANFIITVEKEPAAWLKINGLNGNIICISMLVVDDNFKRKGVGSFAVRFSEEYAQKNNKTAIRIQTTTDNIAATECYLKQDYKIVKEMKYAVGDGIMRDGYEFIKELQRT